jgi:flagellar L-ring protein precursor FlgH
MTGATMSIRFFRSAVTCVLALLLACCAMQPSVNLRPPMTARATPPSVTAPANGAIFQAQYVGQPGYSHRPLFEDRRPRAVGDILTININETTAASKTTGSTAARTSANDTSISTVAGLPGKGLQGMNLTTNSSSTFEGKGDSASNNVFTGIISVTVIEVLPNGNLLVSGEKQIGINQGSEIVSFSGVVNPDTISSGNAVSSTQVADARVEYRGKGYLDEAQKMGWLQRIFLSVNPF